MLFCFTATYAPQAVHALLAAPATDRREAVVQLLDAVGGTLHGMYSTDSDGLGVLVIFETPNPYSGPALAAVVSGTGTLENVKLTRLLTLEEMLGVHHEAAKLRAAYRPAGS